MVERLDVLGLLVKMYLVSEYDFVMLDVEDIIDIVRVEFLGLKGVEGGGIVGGNFGVFDVMV